MTVGSLAAKPTTVATIEHDLRRQLSNNRRALFWMLIAAALEASIAAATPWLVAQVIDSALPDAATNTLGALVILIAAANAHRAGIGWVHERIEIELRHRLEAVTLTGLFSRLMALDFAQLERRGFGATNEVLSAGAVVCPAVVAAFTTGTARSVAAVAVLFVLGHWFPILALVTLSVWVCAALAAVVVASVEARRGQRVIDFSGRQQQWLSVLLHGAALTRAAGVTQRLVADWDRVFHGYVATEVARKHTTVLRELVLKVAERSVWVGTTIFLVSGALSGSVSLGEMLMGLALVGQLSSAVTAVVGAVVNLRALRPQFERVNELLAETPAASRSKASTLSLLSGPTGLNNVAFRYDQEGPWILRNCNLQIPNEQVSIVRAASGRGKTTLLRLLAGLLQPDHGQIKVLGRDASTMASSVAYLPSQPCLLEGTILDNLRVLSGASEERIVNAAQATGLLELLQQLPMGFDTFIASNGENLSAGQRQLLLLTAVFSSPCPVVLLDEPDAHLDADARGRINWPALVAGRTVVVVTHAQHTPISDSVPIDFEPIGTPR